MAMSLREARSRMAALVALKYRAFDIHKTFGVVTICCLSISERTRFKSYCEASVKAFNSLTTNSLRSAREGKKSARRHNCERSYCAFISTTISICSSSLRRFISWLNTGSRQLWANPDKQANNNVEIRTILFMALHFYDFIHDDTLFRVNFQHINAFWQIFDTTFISIYFNGFQ